MDGIKDDSNSNNPVVSTIRRDEIAVYTSVAFTEELAKETTFVGNRIRLFVVAEGMTSKI